MGPSAGGSSARPMCVHYSDQRALSSGEAKAQVLSRLLEVLDAYPAATVALQGGPCTQDVLDLTWEDAALAARHVHGPPAGAGISSSSSTPPPMLHPTSTIQSAACFSSDRSGVLGSGLLSSEATVSGTRALQRRNADAGDEEPLRKRPKRMDKRPSYRDSR